MARVGAPGRTTADADADAAERSAARRDGADDGVDDDGDERTSSSSDREADARLERSRLERSPRRAAVAGSATIRAAARDVAVIRVLRRGARVAMRCG